MTDRAKKISELNAHSNPAGNNLLVIVNNPGVANAETMKISLNNLFGNVAASATFNNTLTSTANTTLSRLAVGGAVSITNAVSITGATTIVGAAAITGNTAITGSVSATGDSTVSGNSSVTGRLTVNGSIRMANVTINTTAISTGSLFTNTHLTFISNNAITQLDNVYHEDYTTPFGRSALVVAEELRASVVISSDDLVLDVPAQFPTLKGLFFSNVDDYSQVVMFNRNNGNNASSDYILTADIGTDSSNYGDFGVASSTYAYPGFEIIKPLDVYLFSSDTDLMVGSTGSNTGVIIFAGGGDTTNKHSQFHSNGQLEVLNATKTEQLYLSNTTNTPSDASASGKKGEIRVDSSYIYVCVADNIWKRAAISTW